MKKVWAMILFGLCAMQVYSQSLHAILVADTDQDLTGAGHIQNLQIMKQEVATICQLTLLRPQVYVIEKDRLTTANLLSVSNGLQCSKEDVILFYFSGSEHIGRAKNTQQAYLLLKDGSLAVSEINEILGMYEPRLSIMITDLCNTVSSKELDFPQTDNPSKERYLSLFLRSKGKLSLSNHVAREQVDINVHGRGSIFTNSLIEAIQHGKDTADWKAVLQDTRYQTVMKSRGSQNPQFVEQTQSSNTPLILPPVRNQTTNKIVFGEELAKTEVKPESQDIKTPEKQAETTTDQNLPLGVWAEEGLAKVTNFQENISALSNIKNSRYNQQQRTDMMANIMGLFADNMRALVESSDLKQQISSQNLKKYLGTLYSSNEQQNTRIDWYKPAEITDFVKQSNKSYKAQVRIFQEFRQTNPNDELLYGDRVEKIVDLWAKLEKENGTWVWKLSLGNIRVVKGSTQSIPK